MNYSLEGLWTATLQDKTSCPVTLPGTLDESGIGFTDLADGKTHPDAEANAALCVSDTLITTRFTRKHTYTGSAVLERDIALPEQLFTKEQPRIFLTAERARCLSLSVDGVEVPLSYDASLSTPYVFELTSYLKKKAPETTRFSFVSDNSYPGLPAFAITYSSAATDETQTNWNGILGEFSLETREAVFLQDLRVYPKEQTLTVQVTLDAATDFTGSLTLSCDALKAPFTADISVTAGVQEFSFDGLALNNDISRWEEGEGNLSTMTADLSNGACAHATFGIRTFGTDGKGHFALNGRRIFLLSEANCAEFPETGHPPMRITEWEEILKLYRSYGVNHLRFHSHCPPEAAFTAADRCGVLMQVELSQWDPQHALEEDINYNYYKKELLCILKHLANHPSFVMLTLGNELHATEEGHARWQDLVQLARSVDSTRLYAEGSNAHYGWNGCPSYNDFYTTQQHRGDSHLRATFACHDKERRHLDGYLNNHYPDARHNFDASVEVVRREFFGPVYGFEVGQYEILPDFEEIKEFQGVSLPNNLRWIQENVEKAGLMPRWKEYLQASGELSRLCYREETEAALRTRDFSGLSLLGIQDFPGQGTALVGMVNSHLKTKPYDFARPEKFRAFFTNRLPLVLLPKYTYTNTETLEADIVIANYGREDIFGSLEICTTFVDGFNVDSCQKVIQHTNNCPHGTLTTAGHLTLPLTAVATASRLTLTVRLNDISNTYPLWVYPEVTPVCPDSVYETKHFNEKAKEVLSSGGTVFLCPDSTKEQLPNSILGQFSTDFWSVGTFHAQEGGMGLYIDNRHPLFAHFPTEVHTNWQWWPMANARALILPEELKNFPCIVTQMDSYAYLRPMTMLLECRCDNGKLLLSTMGLHNMQQYPEARALLHSIYTYLSSDAFAPAQEITPEQMAGLVK